jgi:hypothetical protein
LRFRRARIAHASVGVSGRLHLIFVGTLVGTKIHGILLSDSITPPSSEANVRAAAPARAVRLRHFLATPVTSE